jgi:hypothetical protein
MGLKVNVLVGFGAGTAAAAATYRYFRVEVTKTIDSNKEMQCVEYDISDDGGSTWYPTQTMTSNTAPSPLVASASDEGYSGQRPFNAFDNDTATNSHFTSRAEISAGSPAWLQIDLGAGNGIAPDRFRFNPQDTNSDSCPEDFTLEASNTGSWSGEETVLLTETGLTSGWSAGTYREFAIEGV